MKEHVKRHVVDYIIVDDAEIWARSAESITGKHENNPGIGSRFLR